MADVFLSYSRRDSEFVRRLADALDATGKDVWVDVEGIRDGEVFPAALRSAVEGSDGFVFVISPDSVGSKFCNQEVDHAVELGKRIVPLAYRRVPDDEIPESIRERNWIPFDSPAEFGPGVERLVGALDTDLEHTKAHTRWLVKALEWDAAGRDRSFLLRGAELGSAERWLGEGAGKDPEPTAVQHEYVYASRAAATRRLRILAGAMALALTVSVALAVIALTQRNAARHQSAIAGSRELAAVSENQLLIDPELAALIGEEAVKRQPTPQATLALRESLDALALRRTLVGHREAVGSVAFSPDGRVLASASRGVGDPSVRVWDVRSGRQLRVIYPNGRPRSPGPPPPGTAGPAGVGAPVFVPKGQGPGSATKGQQFPNTATFSPDGKQLVVGLDSGGVAFYDLATGRLLTKVGGPNSHVDSIHFAADGRLGLVSGVGPPVVADLATRRPLRRLPLPGHDEQVFYSDISPDGRFAAMANPDGYAVWDVATGRIVHRLTGDIGVTVAFSPTSPLLAIGGHAGRIALIDPRTGHEVRKLADVAPAGPNRFAWSPDGKRLAAALTDGTARIWDAASGRELERFAGHRCCVLSVAFSPDGRLLATGAEDHKVNLWSSNGNVLYTLHAARKQITGLTFTAGGNLAITAQGADTVIWRPGARAGARVVEGARDARQVVASPDGRTLAVAGPGTHAAIVDAASGKTERTLGAPNAVQAVAFDRSAKRVVVASNHGTRIFAVRDGRPLSPQGPEVITTQVAFLPTRNAIAVALFDVGPGAALWFQAVPSGRVIGRVSSPGPFTAMSVNPSGSLVAAVARADPGIRLFDVGTVKEVRELLGHISDVQALAWSADGRMLASGGVDGTVRVWNPTTGDELRVIRHGAPVYAVAFSRDGSRLAFGDADGSVSVWPGCPGCSSPQALLALAREKITRRLSPLERRTFLNH